MTDRRPPKFRGAVQDRPMLSAVHGVEGHYTAALHPFAAKTRNEVGGFQGERAIMQMDPTMPMVITSDKGLFAKRANGCARSCRGITRTSAASTAVVATSTTRRCSRPTGRRWSA